LDKQAIAAIVGIVFDHDKALQAQRRKLDRDRTYDSGSETFVDDKKRFYPIAGDVFVLRYDEVKTLNVTYLSLEPKK
jgi:hypothetical protein